MGDTTLDPAVRDPAPEAPPEILMPLLSRITATAIDEDYALVAAKRQREEGSRESSGRWRAWPAVTVVAGLLIAVGVTQSVQEASDDQASRPTLISRVDATRAELKASQKRIAAVSATIRDLEREGERIDRELRSGDAEIGRLRVRTGFGAVVGPGIEAVVNDSPSGDELEAVRDEDLALLVDGLWSAGAEAIAINGQRLTVLSYIQNSGPAIHVNSQPLLAPYHVQAIGDPRTLQANFVETSSGARFGDLVRVLGFDFDMHNESELNLPGARLRPLRQARPGTSGEIPKPLRQGGTP